MDPLRNVMLGGAAVLVLSLAAAAAAQTTSTTTTSDNGKRHVVVIRDGKTVTDTWTNDDGHHGPMMVHVDRRNPERRAEHLRTVLQLTPAQEPALQAFLAAMQPKHEHEHEHGDFHFAVARGQDGKVDAEKVKADAEKFRAEMQARRAEMEKKRAEEAALTTPQKLDRMVKRMAEESAKRQAELQAHVEAVKRFYAALSPAQQKAFDALHEGGMGGGMHMFRHREVMEGPGEMRVMRFGMAPMPPMPPLPPLPPAPPAPPAGAR